jgi:hypothetical protein
MLSALALLASCTERNPPNSAPGTMDYPQSVRVYTDAETGCQYLVDTAYKQGGITPRLNSNGQPVCGESVAR